MMGITFITSVHFLTVKKIPDGAAMNAFFQIKFTIMANQIIHIL